MTTIITPTQPILALGFDLESTGLNQTDGHRIIEVYMGLYDMTAGGKKVDELNQRIHPQRGIDEEAENVHHIGFEDLVGCPYWEQVAPQIHQFMSRGNFVVAHNGEGFDMPFIMGEFVRAGLPLIHMPIVDTMLQGRWATPDGVLPNLRALCFACGVEYDPSKAHAADYDVDVMMQCFMVGMRAGVLSVPQTPYMFKPMPTEAAKKAAKRK